MLGSGISEQLFLIAYCAPVPPYWALQCQPLDGSGLTHQAD